MREPKPMTPGLARLVHAIQHLDMDENIRFREVLARNLKNICFDVPPMRLESALRDTANDIEAASKRVENLDADVRAS